MEDFYRPAYKTPEINGVGNGYVISNETAGLYHTGSRIRLCDEREDNSSTGYHRTDMTRSQEYIQHKQSREKRIYSMLNCHVAILSCCPFFLTNQTSF